MDGCLQYGGVLLGKNFLRGYLNVFYFELKMIRNKYSGCFLIMYSKI